MRGPTRLTREPKSSSTLFTAKKCFRYEYGWPSLSQMNEKAGERRNANTCCNVCEARLMARLAPPYARIRPEPTQMTSILLYKTD